MFTFATLVFQVEIDGDIREPYVFYRFKDLFPDSFFRSASLFLDMNGYEDVFSQTLTTDPSALKRFQKPPLPFAFRLPIFPQGKRGKCLCEIALSLAGSAVNHLKIFVTAVEDTLKSISSEQRFRAVVTSISTLGPDKGHTDLVHDYSGLTLLSDQDFNLLPTDDIGGLSLTLLSPMNLVHEGRSLDRLDFSGFIRPLMRRVSSLAYYYSGSELELDFKALSEQSTEVEIVSTGLTKERWGNRGSGIVGEVVFRGTLQQYLPILMIGEQFNLGKGAAYGMGAFRLCISK